MSAPVIEALGLACGYADRAVLGDLNFAIGAGEFVGVLGANGAGKSTLIKTLAGILPPLGGAVRLNGRPLGTYAPRALALQRAYMAQQADESGAWRVAEVLAMGRFPHQRGWGLTPGSGDRASLAAAVAATDLAGILDRPLATLSGGQRQRVHLARALAQGAPLLLLDEPTTHLDLAHQLDFFHLIQRVLAQANLTAVAVLHDLNLAAQFCSRLLVVKEGLLLADGPPDQIFEPDLIEAAFGLHVQVRHHPQTGTPYVLPLQRASTGSARSGRLRAAGATRGSLHVIAGGGAGERLLGALYRLGYEPSVGVINALDTDLAVASRLGLAAIVEAPFSAIGGDNLEQLAIRLRAVDGVVVGDVAFGSGNVGNLRVLAALGLGERVYLVTDTPIARRDFTGGEATALWEGLIHDGAIAGSSDALLQKMAAH